MFDITLQLLQDFIPIIPIFVVLVLVFNIIASLLWGDK